MEGVALKYIPSIRFELDFYRILCRIFCFGEIFPVVRDFCSLSLVFNIVVLFFLFFSPSQLLVMGSSRGNDYCWHIHLDAVNNSQSRNAQR